METDTEKTDAANEADAANRIDTANEADAANPIDYEEVSYGKIGYKRIQRLRKKGARRGIEVPQLNYELTKPDKPRVAFWVIAVISAIIFVGILVGIGFLYNEMVKLFSDMDGLGDFFVTMFNPKVFIASFGTSVLPGLLVALVYLLVAVLLIIPIIAAICFYCFVRDSFYMAKCSKEEFAKGEIISSRIFGIGAVIIGVTVIFIVLMIYLTSSSAKLWLGLIYGGVVIALGGLLALIVVEKKKCAKWFEGLDEDKRQNYLEHESALRRVKSRINSERRFWRSLGK